VGDDEVRIADHLEDRLVVEPLPRQVAINKTGQPGDLGGKTPLRVLQPRLCPFDLDDMLPIIEYHSLDSDLDDPIFDGIETRGFRVDDHRDSLANSRGPQSLYAEIRVNFPQDTVAWHRRQSKCEVLATGFNEL
jgi:hypothetical protein